jgi:Glycosyl hydrolases family 2, sugar binding domain
MSVRELKLSRRWSILADPDDVGVAWRWWESPPSEGWHSIRADQAWQHVLGTNYHGVAWYRRRARLPKKWLSNDTRIWLRFEAVATDCTVWVNGAEVGRHVGDYLPFQFEITEEMGQSERCEIVCRVDEIEGHEPSEWGAEPWGGHITKGFHDVLSLQHGGIWNGVSVHRTGPIAIKPNGVRVDTDAQSHAVTVHVELEPHDAEGRVALRTLSPDNRQLADAVIELARGQTSCSSICDIGTERGKGEGAAELWSLREPKLYSMCATASIRQGGRLARWTSDESSTRVAFRSIKAGGTGGRQILLNGEPLLIKGVLHWGHEPAHIAPSPTPDRVRAEFAHLKARGFNCVCMCMWYAPEWFYDIADETGMLIWQEHPVWKSDMSDEHIDEYKRLFEGFLRRDAQHPSVVIVSATCEHEKFNPDLASWWWGRANELLPDKLLQLQTAFVSWTDSEKTDLYDEHTYENTGRWLAYLSDLDRELAAMEPRPFVMGETAIANHWPDIAAIDALLSEAGHDPSTEYPWWITRGLDACRAIEADVAARFGKDTLDRFRTQADVFSLEHRKRQVEALRASGLCSGWVMNHIRDVPKCRCGFMDDTDRWRHAPEQTRPWLGDVVLCLRTPDDRRAFEGGHSIDIAVSVSGDSSSNTANSSASVAAPGIELHVDSVAVETCAEPGDTQLPQTPHGAGHALPQCPAAIRVPSVTQPTRIRLRATSSQAEPNEWSIWALPPRDALPANIRVLAGHAFTDQEREMTFEERKYSSGWGLENRSWRPSLPDPAALFPGAPATEASDLNAARDLLVTHRLTDAVCAFIESGGRAVLLASRACGVATQTVDLWGQVPLVIEADDVKGSPIRAGESACVLDLLHLDLTRHHQRAIPTQRLGIGHRVEPFVRFVRTHDDGVPTIFDALFAARLGDGLLVVSSLDHTEPAGCWLLDRTIQYASSCEVESMTCCPSDQLRTPIEGNASKN